MTDLETAFYILGIVYMSVMLVLIIGLLITALVIKNKVDRMHRMIEEKVNAVRDVTDKAAVVMRTLRHFVKS
jgi:hypothetical protein